VFWPLAIEHGLGHYMLGRSAFITDAAVERLRLVVSVYGDDYLTWVQARDMYATDTLVNTVLYSADISHAASSIQELLGFLIHACPAALKISSLSVFLHNAFTAVVQRCDCPQNLLQQCIVRTCAYACV